MSNYVEMLRRAARSMRKDDSSIFIPDTKKLLKGYISCKDLAEFVQYIADMLE